MKGVFTWLKCPLYLVVGISAVSDMLDNCPVGNWVHLNGLLYHPVEQHSARSRSPSVKSKGELVEVVVKMLVAYRAMEGTRQPCFQQPHHVMHAR